MFKRREEAAPQVVQPVDVETYAVSNGANRIRKLEAELVATFEEWYKAQQASVERSVHVEFAMSPWLGAAWSRWRSEKFSGGNVDDAPTIDIAKPDGVADVNAEISDFFVAEIRETGHLYWPYQRETLCGRSKIHKPTFYWWMTDLPLCAECCKVKVEAEMEERRKRRAA